jgi:hypothetical protein
MRPFSLLPESPANGFTFRAVHPSSRGARCRFHDVCSPREGAFQQSSACYGQRVDPDAAVATAETKRRAAMHQAIDCGRRQARGDGHEGSSQHWREHGHSQGPTAGGSNITDCSKAGCTIQYLVRNFPDEQCLRTRGRYFTVLDGLEFGHGER